MVKKIIALGVVLVIVCLIVIYAFYISDLRKWEDRYDTDKVSVAIKADFRDKYLAEEFSVEDFEWDNVEKIEYLGWSDNISTGGMKIYLKKHGRRQVLDAVEHFKKLDFVKIATVVGYYELY